jgi:HAD superfamily hydrolase (TIGR01509 family)
MLQGILLDIDGTLLASNDAHARAWEQAFREFGHDIPAARIQPLVGMGGDKLLDTLIPGLTDTEPPGKQMTERRKAIFLHTYAPHLQPTPGARDLVRRLKTDGLTITIATSAKSDELEALLRAADVQDLIEHRTTSDDAEESKPAPDIVTAALKKSGLPPDAALMIGDTPYDIESAARAGVGIIALRSGGHRDDELHGALAIYNDPADLLAHYHYSPPANRHSSAH